ncbi:hypothetical protein Tco_1402273 [Tanacetum coccineum]
MSLRQSFWGANDEGRYRRRHPGHRTNRYDGLRYSQLPTVTRFIPGPEDPQTPPPITFLTDSTLLLSHLDMLLNVGSEEDPRGVRGCGQRMCPVLWDYLGTGGGDGDDVDGDSSRDDDRDEDKRGG